MQSAQVPYSNSEYRTLFTKYLLSSTRRHKVTPKIQDTSSYGR